MERPNLDTRSLFCDWITKCYRLINFYLWKFSVEAMFAKIWKHLYWVLFSLHIEVFHSWSTSILVVKMSIFSKKESVHFNETDFLMCVYFCTKFKPTINNRKCITCQLYRNDLLFYILCTGAFIIGNAFNSKRLQKIEFCKNYSIFGGHRLMLVWE